MEKIYICLDRLPITTINIKGSLVQAFVVDKHDDQYRYITVVASESDECIRENERVSLRVNKHGNRYIKRLPEIDESNSELMGYIARFSLEPNAFIVMSDSKENRLITGFQKDLRDKCLALVPFETLVAAIPKYITEEKQPTFFYFSERYTSSVITYGCIRELERAISRDQVIMSHGNRYVLNATKRIVNKITNANSNENLSVSDRQHAAAAISSSRAGI